VKKACIVIGDSYFHNNRLFDLTDPISNRDNCLLPFAKLKGQLKYRDIDLSTDDIHSIEESDIVIYNEMPVTMPSLDKRHKSYLLLFESELIRPENWNLEKHDKFDKIFTWHDDYVDNKKYFKINFSHQMPESIPKCVQKDKLCCIIAGNKRVQHPLELYSKRIEAIRWFEIHHPEDFDLFGMGWNEYRFSGSKLMRALNRIKPLTRFLAEKYPSYRGSVANKKETLKKYKFSICYENAKDIPGYITEKIFDCFFAGCVPVYWGANNITDYIPERCFIDKGKFSDYESLYQYMRNMPDDEYMNYLDAIEAFIQAREIQQFSVDYFAKTIAEQVTQ